MLVCESARVSRGRRVRACLVYKLAPSSLLSFFTKKHSRPFQSCGSSPVRKVQRRARTPPWCPRQSRAKDESSLSTTWP